MGTKAMRSGIERVGQQPLFMNVNKRYLVLFTLIFVTILGLGQFASTSAAPVQQGTIPTNPHVRLIGPIQAQDEDRQTWTVAGVSVQISDARMMARVGPAIVGVWVRVDGEADGNGGIIASRIKVMPPQRFVKLSGILGPSGEGAGEARADIGGIGITLNAGTKLKDTPSVGDVVLGKLELQPDNRLLALHILNTTPADDKPEGDSGNGSAMIEDEEGDEDEAGSLDSDTQLQFIGIVQALPTDGTRQGDWVVSGISVRVDENTTIQQRVGPTLVGSWVRIAGDGNGDGAIQARKIYSIRTQQHHRLYGTLDNLADDAVMVNGIYIPRNMDTTLRGNMMPGNGVMVRSIWVADENDVGAEPSGQLLANRIIARPDSSDAGNGMGEGSDQEKRLVGTILRLPANGLNGIWRIVDDGVEMDVMVNANTLIDEHKAYAALNALVHIRAAMDADGNMIASEITVVAGATNEGPIETGGLYIEFMGQIESIPSRRAGDASPEERLLNGIWSIAGHQVEVTDSTEIEGDESQIVPGTLVEVIGYSLPNGRVHARQIRVKELYVDLPEMDEVHLRGKIESRPVETPYGTWMIDGHLIEVVETTHLDKSNGAAVVGATAKVIGAIQPDGTIVAGLFKIILVNTYDEANLYVKIQGTVEQMPENALHMGQWLVLDGTGMAIDVNVTPYTYLDEGGGPLGVGSQVTVEGIHAIDGSIVAFQIKSQADPDDMLEEIKFYGVVLEAPTTADGLGSWTIMNNVGRTRRVLADGATSFPKGIPLVDSLVRVKGIFQADGVVMAQEIELADENPAHAAAIQFQDEIIRLPENPELLGVWQVGEWQVEVDESTFFERQDGEFAPGQMVVIEATFVDDPTRSADEGGKVRASWIKTIGTAHREWLSIHEPIVRLPDAPDLHGEWQIGQWRVIASHETGFKRDGAEFAEGDMVWVEGWINVSDPNLASDPNLPIAEAAPLYAVVIKRSETDESHVDETGNHEPGDGATDEGVHDTIEPERISIQDPVVSLPDTPDLIGEWRIGDWIVVVSDATELKRFTGEFEVGKRVWVDGIVEYEDLPIPEEGATVLPVFGRIHADWVKTIEGEDTEPDQEWASVKEAIVRLPDNPELVGEWQVGNWTVLVDEETLLNRHAGEFEIDQQVWVEGWFTHPEDQPIAQNIGEIQALSIMTIDETGQEPGVSIVEFGGTLVAFPPEMIGTWHIGDYDVMATDETEFIEGTGPFGEGAFVTVSGRRDEDGLIHAIWIKTADAPSTGFEFIDPIINYPEELVGTWRIGQYEVIANENTQFIEAERAFRNGVFARVEGFLMADGSVQAHLIEALLTPDPNNVRVFGPLQAFPPDFVGLWSIGEWTVIATEDTVFVQEIGLFDREVIVKAEGIPQDDGTILASEIKVLELPGPQWMVTKGHVISLPDSEDRVGEWQIGTRKMMVTAATYLDPEPGAFTDDVFVEVRGILQEDDSLLAIWVHVIEAPLPDVTRVTDSIVSFPTGRIGEWQVGEWTVIADENTQFSEDAGAFAEGTFVEVEGAPSGNMPTGRLQSENGGPMLQATSIKTVLPPNTEWVRKVGTLNSYPEDYIGAWQIDEHEVYVTEGTQLDEAFGPFTLGGQVEFEAGQDANGLWSALWVKTVETQAVPEFSMKGLVEYFPPELVGGWLVHGMLVSADEQTQFDESEAPFIVGELVEITGAKIVDGTLVAGTIKSINRYISPDWFRLAEPIRHLPENGLIGEWQVGDITVRVTADTLLEEDGWPFMVGTYVAMEGVLEEDGIYHALVIKTVPSPYYEQVTIGGTILDKMVGDGMDPGNGPAFNGVGEWLVDDTHVIIRAETEFKEANGPLDEGVWVIVEGYLTAEGKLLAISLRSAEPPNNQWFEISGEIVERPTDLLGTWVIGEMVVSVTEDTDIRGDIGPLVQGEMVNAKIVSDGGDGWVAVWIEPAETEPQGKTLYVGPYPEDCVGVAAQQCLLVREDPNAEWTLFYDSIVGFDYVEGCTYELRINEEQIDNPPADGSSIRLTLVEVVSATCVPTASPVLVVGIVMSMPQERIGIWAVENMEVVVNEETQFNEDVAPLSVGVQVEISALQLADGTIEATNIIVMAP